MVENFHRTSRRKILDRRVAMLVKRGERVTGVDLSPPVENAAMVSMEKRDYNVPPMVCLPPLKLTNRQFIMGDDKATETINHQRRKRGRERNVCVALIGKDNSGDRS